MGAGRLTVLLPELPVLLLELELEGEVLLLVDPVFPALELELVVWLDVVSRIAMPSTIGAGAAETMMGETAAAKRTRVLKTLCILN